MRPRRFTFSRCSAQVELLSLWSDIPHTHNAATLIAELGDLSRFADPLQLMAYLGLVPCEHSSGASVKRGGITKAGNSAAGRLLHTGSQNHIDGEARHGRVPISLNAIRRRTAAERRRGTVQYERHLGLYLGSLHRGRERDTIATNMRDELSSERGN